MEPRRTGPIVMCTVSLSGEIMKVRVSKNNNDVYLAELSGNMDMRSSNHLKDLVMKTIKKRVECFIISLAGIKDIDSAGIGALINISSTLKKLGCPLVILAPGGPALQALEVTRLKGYFPIAGSFKEALALAGIPYLENKNRRNSKAKPAPKGRPRPYR